MMLPLDINKHDKILIVAPHPDDECIGCGGLMALFPKQIDIIVASDGSYGSRGLSPTIVKEIRSRELKNEINFAKVNSCIQLSYKDGSLAKEKDIFNEIDLTKYTKVFVPSNNDDHPDHTAISDLAVEEAKRGKIKGDLYYYEVHCPLHSPTHGLVIDSEIEKKLRMIRFHESQITNIAYDEIAKGLARYRSSQMGYNEGYAEAYYKVNLSLAGISQDNQMTEIMLQKNRQFVKVLTNWNKALIDGRAISDIINEKGFSSISIYGYSSLGELLYSELVKEGFTVIDVIDKQTKKIDESKQTKAICVANKVVDAVIVTALYDYEYIKKELNNNGFPNVISLAELFE